MADSSIDPLHPPVEPGTSDHTGRTIDEQSDLDDKDSDYDTSMDETFERPNRVALPKSIKREFDPVSGTPQPGPTVSQAPSYAYLNLGLRNFRVLCLKPGYKDDTIVCSFRTVSIGESTEYEALTYFWGGNNPGSQDSIRIELEDIQKRPHPVFIRSNLHVILKNFRHPTKVGFYWIDSLCINRSNRSEVDHQVAMKLSIFHNAKNVCLWLGEDESCEAGLMFIEKILNVARINILLQKARYIVGWSNFVALLKNIVFSRLWFVQEISVSKSTTLHAGRKAVQYADFVEAVSVFASCRNELSRLFRDNGKDFLDLVDHRITITNSFVDITADMIEKLRQDRSIRHRHNLETLVSLLTDLDCTDHRDRVFAVLSLARDGLSPPPGTLMEAEIPRGSVTERFLQIDYRMSLQEVYQGFVVHVIAHSKSLDIICRRWARAVPEREAMPTWVRPLGLGQQPQSTLQSKSERTEADSLVGLPHHKFYSASGAKFAEWTTEINTADTVSLVVKGFKIDHITRLGPRASEGNILYEWLELGGCDLTDEADIVPDQFWRTLVGNQDSRHEKSPSWYHRAFLYCLSHRTEKVDIITNRLIQEYEDQSSLVVEFLKRVQSVIWNKKLLVCDEGKLIGLAPMATQVGDVICILYGCSVPVVLRPVEHINFGQYWSVVGECYVHGIMNGEMIRDALNPIDEDEHFELR